MQYIEICRALSVEPTQSDYEIIGMTQSSSLEGNDWAHLCWISDNNLAALDTPLMRTVICSPAAAQHPQLADANLIQVENPRNAFRMALRLFDTQQSQNREISKAAHIDRSVKIGANVAIGPGTLIEANSIIGDNVVIGANTVILRDCVIHDLVKIGNNCTIGGVGFGYEQDESGQYAVLPHLGNVVIMDNVEIGNNTCIDRAVLGSTILRENVKIDNLVHIAHGCDIGRNSLVIANAMVAGSVKIGENSWIAPSASILNQKTVGSNVMIGLGAVVRKDVPDDDIVVGNPAKSIKR